MHLITRFFALLLLLGVPLALASPPALHARSVNSAGRSLTNAERLARGLTPSRPRRFFSSNRVRRDQASTTTTATSLSTSVPTSSSASAPTSSSASAPASSSTSDPTSSTAPAPTSSTAPAPTPISSGTIALSKKSDGSSAGYIDVVGLTQILIVSNPSSAQTFKNPNLVGLASLPTTSSGWHLAGGNFGATSLGPASGNFVWLSITLLAEPPYSRQYDSPGTYPLSEAAIFLVSPTGAITVQWTNPDETQVPAYLYAVNDEQIAITGDVDALSPLYPGGYEVTLAFA